MPHRKGLEDLLGRYFKKDQNIQGVEIGILKGDLSHHLLSCFPNLYLTGIDPYVQWTEVIDNTKLFSNRYQLIPLHSDVASNLLCYQYDFIFIDGDHSCEQCRKDIVNYMRLVKPGGIFAGHNYHKGPCPENGMASGNSSHPGVHQSVDEIFGDKVKLQPDFIWYVQI